MVHRSRADWPVVVAAFALLVCAIGLLATGALYGDTVALGGLRQAILAAPPIDRAVVVRTAATADELPAVDAAIRDELATALASSGGEVALVAGSGSLVPVGLDTETARQHLTQLASFEDIERHASLTSGRWGVAGKHPLEATLSEGAAAALGLGIGDRVRLTRGLTSSDVVELEVVGLWRPDPDDGYWLGDRLDLDGVRQDEALITRGPFVVAPADLLASAATRQLDLEWRGLPDVDGLAVDGIDALRQGIEGVKPGLRTALPPPREVSVVTNLPAILAAAGRSILVSRSGVTLLTIQFAVLAGYAVLLVAGLLLDRRRSETALLRSRGATSGHLVAFAFGEALMLAVPAAIVAPFLAVGAVRLLGALGPLGASEAIGSVGITQSTVTASVVAAGLCIAVLTLPSLIGEASPAGIRAALGRQVGRTMAQRLGIDLALVVLAIVALWQLRLYGAPLTRNARGVLGVDPLLVAAPAIGLLAGAVLATRIVPRLAEVGERLLARRSGVVPPLGARQVARRPLRYTRSALLLVLAAALGTFAAASAATWARSQVDQAAYRAAGDVRVVLSDYPDLPGWAVGSAYRAVPGVTAATPVSSQSLDVGRTVRDGRLVGLDPGAIERIVPLSGAGTTSADLAALAAARPVTAAVGLAGRPRRLAVTIDAGLEVNTAGSGDTQAPPDWKAVAAAVVLRDGDGRIHRLDVGETALAATGERIVLDLGRAIDDLPVEPTAPLRLESVELTITPPPGLVIDGTVELGGLAVSPTDAGDDWTPVALDPAAAGWLWTRTGPEGTTVYRPPTDAPGRIEIGRGDDASPALFGSFDQPGATYRLAASPTGDGIVPVIAGERLLALTGAHVGDTIRVSSAGQDLTVRIVASAAAFPPLDPNEPFLVADGTTLDLVRFAANGYPAAATEWLLAADDRQAEAIATTLAGRPYSASQVILRTELAHALAADPIWLGIVGALALGALAAVMFAAIGFVVGATVSTSERLGELALLRALGLSGRQLAAWLTLEQVFLLTVGLVGGSLLGALLAWLVLPYSTLDVTGAAVVPTPVIVVPWEAILPVYFVLAVVLLGTVSILARQVPERRMSRVLRAGET